MRANIGDFNSDIEESEASSEEDDFLGDDTLVGKPEEKRQLTYMTKKFDGTTHLDKVNNMSREGKRNMRSQEFKKRQFLESDFMKNMENEMEERPIETVRRE